MMFLCLDMNHLTDKSKTMETRLERLERLLEQRTQEDYYISAMGKRGFNRILIFMSFFFCVIFFSFGRNAIMKFTFLVIFIK